MQNVWNPPWLLVFFMPLGFLPFKIASVIWLWLNLVLIGISVLFVSGLTSQTGKERFLIWVFIGCIIFGPTLSLIVIGQVSTIILISLLGCLYFMKKNRYDLAGAVLLMAVIKPHIVYFVFPLLSWHALRLRKWQFFAGMFLAGLISIFIIILFFPRWPTAYVALLGKMHISAWYTSTLWSLLDVVFQRPIFHWGGLFLLPLIFWFELHFEHLGDLTVLNLSLLLSIAFAPYGYLFDQIVLLPALVQLLAWLVSKEIRKSIRWISSIGLLLMTIGEFILLAKSNLPYYYFFWIPFAMLLIYFIAFKARTKNTISSLR